jgi:hypothetical protein
MPEGGNVRRSGVIDRAGRYRATQPNQLTLIILASVFMLTCCEQMRQITGAEKCDDPAMSSAERQLCSDSTSFNQTVAGGAVIGTVAGAVVGTVACAAAHSKTNPLACGAIGAGVGLFAGGISGYVVAKRQQAAKDQTRAIDGVTSDLKQQNDALRREISTARSVAVEDRQKLTHMKTAIKNGQMSSEQAAAERERISADSRHLQTVIENLEQQQQNFEGAGAELKESSPGYRSQVAELKSQIATLKQQKETLDRAISVSG